MSQHTAGWSADKLLWRVTLWNGVADNVHACMANSYSSEWFRPVNQRTSYQKSHLFRHLNKLFKSDTKLYLTCFIISAIYHILSDHILSAYKLHRYISISLVLFWLVERSVWLQGFLCNTGNHSFHSNRAVCIFSSINGKARYSSQSNVCRTFLDESCMLVLVNCMA